MTDDGRGVALQLVKDGCSKLALAGSNQADLSAVEADCRAVRQEGLEVLTVVCDTNSPTSIDEFIMRVIDKFKEIHYCANCERPQATKQNTLDIDPSTGRLPAMEWQRSVRSLESLELYQEQV